MATFLLIRHCATDAVGKILAGRMPGIHLNPAGAAQLAELTQRVERFRASWIYSSPLERAVETAEALAHGRGTPVSHAQELNDIDFGNWTGKPFVDLDRLPEWAWFNSFRGFAAPPGGESMLDVQCRVMGLIARLEQDHPFETLALVTHADVIKAALLTVLGAPLDMVHRLEIEPASVSALEFAGGSPRVLQINGRD
ncbi:MAG: histidine phosphatase family protein [Bryobacteraceae bacterium]|nr:histidine phosphatase family protein [Bryobacteraceae bacterium]